MEQRHLVNLSFYVRTPVTVDGDPVLGADGASLYRYEPVDTSKYHNSLMDIWSMHPPQIGDLVLLGDGYRVIERSWMFSQRGSSNWPANEPMPTVGPQLTLIVERHAGPFVNEAPRPDADAD